MNQWFLIDNGKRAFSERYRSATGQVSAITSTSNSGRIGGGATIFLNLHPKNWHHIPGNLAITKRNNLQGGLYILQPVMIRHDRVWVYSLS